MPQTYAQLEVDRDWWRDAYFELLLDCQSLVGGVVEALERDVDIDKVTNPNDVND